MLVLQDRKITVTFSTITFRTEGDRRDFLSINVLNTEPTDLYSNNTMEGSVVFCWESEILIDSVLPGWEGKAVLNKGCRTFLKQMKVALIKRL
jgi:hypothetical protein